MEHVRYIVHSRHPSSPSPSVQQHIVLSQLLQQLLPDYSNKQFTVGTLLVAFPLFKALGRSLKCSVMPFPAPLYCVPTQWNRESTLDCTAENPHWGISICHIPNTNNDKFCNFFKINSNLCQVRATMGSSVQFAFYCTCYTT